jgi:hypothetical protein
MSLTVSTDQQHKWLHLAGLSSTAGCAWVAEYTRLGAVELTHTIDSAVVLLRGRHLHKARELLRESEARIKSMPPLNDSISRVLWRWHWSALAYERYCSEDLDTAHELLRQADEEVLLALEQPFLLTLANHCYDFQLQRARIERNRRRWEEVARHVELGRAMLENRQPLCILRSGLKVYITDVDDFHRSIDATDDNDRVALQQILDQGRRREIFEALVRDIYVIPGFVIPYP